jgi:hypothetical protein
MTATMAVIAFTLSKARSILVVFVGWAAFLLLVAVGIGLPRPG